MHCFLVEYHAMENAKNIALLYGGTSSEREISLLSGKNVGEALSSRGHKVVYIDPKEPSDMEVLKSGPFDIAYIALHGKGGEDGTIQLTLEKLNLPYTGSKVQSSATAIDKAASKEKYIEAGVPTAKYVALKKGDEINADEIITITGDDVVVKAASEGSSIGLYFAKGTDEISQAIEKAFDFDDVVLVEKRIPGREFTCAVLEFSKQDMEKFGKNLNFEGNKVALPVIEIIPKNEYYDFASKYDEGGSEHVCPAEIDDNLSKGIQEVAMKAHKCLECSGFSRTDIRVDKDGKVFALETNTIPGMTSKSLVPDAARAVGISFEDLCELIINNELM